MNTWFHPEAEQEFLAAIDYYEQCGERLGFDFAVEVYAAIGRAVALPEAWPVVSGEVRRCQTRRFPYGVLYAQEQRYKEAIEHFQASIRHDPTYQKAYHNLAMAYYLTDKNESALSSVKKALALDSRNKNSTLLMSVILKRLGRIAEAEKVAKKAQLLDEGNWSELMTPMQ